MMPVDVEQIRLGPSLMVGSISATAVYVESLPPPPQLVVARPPTLQHGGGAAGADEKMLLANANKVEQIAAVNRVRLQVRTPLQALECDSDSCEHEEQAE